MVGVNSSYNDTYLSQSKNQRLESTSRDTNTTAEVNKETSQTSQSEVQLSSRGLKVQKLNEEFFQNGAANFTISSEFISRLTEYGLISQDDANQLRQLTNQRKDEPETGGTPLKQLHDFIDEFSKDLDEETDGNLLNILSNAKQVLENYNGGQNNAKDVDARKLAVELNQFNKSEAAEKLSAEDKDALEKLELAMRLADRLNPQATNADKMNSYLNTIIRYA